MLLPVLKNGLFSKPRLNQHIFRGLSSSNFEYLPLIKSAQLKKNYRYRRYINN